MKHVKTAHVRTRHSGSTPPLLGLSIAEGLEDRDNRYANQPRRYNGAPGQDLFVMMTMWPVSPRVNSWRVDEPS